MERLNKKKILVTGGAGFIGSNLVKNLVKKGNEVFVIDIAVHPLSLFNLQNLRSQVTYAKVDIRNKENVFQYFKKNNFDFIFHLAAESIVEESYKYPLTAFETNIMGTAYILEAIRNFGKTIGIIVASSDKAYGKTTKSYTENSPLHGNHPYDVSKSSADLIAQTYAKTYGLPIVITRFGNVYGEGDFHFNRIIPGICEAIVKQQELVLRSDGSYIRDYIYINDVVDGYTCLLQNIEETKGNAYNFSSKDTFSVLQLIERIENITEKKIKYKILNNAKNEIPYQHLSDFKIRELGWKNKYRLDNTISTVLQWYQEKLR